jgi:hypothetical protein
VKNAGWQVADSLPPAHDLDHTPDPGMAAGVFSKDYDHDQDHKQEK